MPKGTKVARCVKSVMKSGVRAKKGSKSKKVSAIRICQKQTGQSYKTGKPIKKKNNPKKGVKYARKKSCNSKKGL